MQAFVGTAKKIFDKIQEGAYDVSNEVRQCASTKSSLHTLQSSHSAQQCAEDVTVRCSGLCAVVRNPSRHGRGARLV